MSWESIRNITRSRKVRGNIMGVAMGGFAIVTCKPAWMGVCVYVWWAWHQPSNEHKHGINTLMNIDIMAYEQYKPDDFKDVEEKLFGAQDDAQAEKIKTILI